MCFDIKNIKSNIPYLPYFS